MNIAVVMKFKVHHKKQLIKIFKKGKHIVFAFYYIYTRSIRKWKINNTKLNRWSDKTHIWKYTNQFREANYRYNKAKRKRSKKLRLETIGYILQTSNYLNTSQ